MKLTRDNTLAIIPFYSGDSGFRRASKKENRLRFLKQTVDSIKHLATCMVFTCTEEDWTEANKIADMTIECDCHPSELIYKLCLYVQNSTLYNHIYKYIIYTDSDHIFNLDTSCLDLTDSVYYVPHRLEEVYNGKGLERGKPYVYNGKTYVIINYSDIGFIGNKIDAYSGCYVCNMNVFKRIKFTNNVPEDAAGFNIYDTAICIKQPIEKFNVIHLSGRDYHESM